MFALMTDHHWLLDTRPDATLTASMTTSHHHVRQTPPPLTPTPPSTTVTTTSPSTIGQSITSAIMPVLLHHTKRKRLDAVLTKLSLSNIKDEPNDDSMMLIERQTMINNNNNNDDDDDDVADDDNKSPSSTLDQVSQDKTPQKQRSVDSEMSINVGNLMLGECRLLPLVIDDDDHDADVDTDVDGHRSASKVVTTKVSSNQVDKDNVDEVEEEEEATTTTTTMHSTTELNFNSSSNFPISTTSVFTPPTINAAGGSTFSNSETENDDDHDDDDDDDGCCDGDLFIKIESPEVTDPTTTTTTTVMRSQSTHKTFGSPSQVNYDWPNEQLKHHHHRHQHDLQQQVEPGKLLSHDSTPRRHRLSENASVPDVQTRSRSNHRSISNVRPAESAPASTTSPPFCTSLFANLPYFGLAAAAAAAAAASAGVVSTTNSNTTTTTSTDTFHSPQSSGKSSPIGADTNMPSTTSTTITTGPFNQSHQHGNIVWSTWSDTLKQHGSKLLIDPFESAKLSHSSNDIGISISPQPISSPASINEMIINSCPRMVINQKKRSHSDSDMYPEYLSLIHSFGSSCTDRTNDQTSELYQTESGVLIRNGRRVPKPLLNAAIVEHVVPQESPLDLSVKPMSAHLINELKDVDLLSLATKSIGNSGSVPSLSTLMSANRCHFTLPNTISPLALHHYHQQQQLQQPYHKMMESTKMNHPYKRRNISSSDSLTSSSLSSICSLSPPYKSMNESKSTSTNTTPKTLSIDSTRFDFHDGGRVKSQFPIIKTESMENDVRTNHAERVVSSSHRTRTMRNVSTSKITKNSKKCCESEMPIGSNASLSSSMSDIDGSTGIGPNTSTTTPASSSSHSCNLCGQTFSYYDRLAKHMASRHRNRQQCDTTAKNYLCDVCQRSFARSDMLTRHMRLHTGIKPYTCVICNQVFSRSDHLSTHQRTHTGEKPYKCPQCPYAACRRDMITRHMKTHSRFEVPDSSSSFEDLSKSA